VSLGEPPFWIDQQVSPGDQEADLGTGYHWASVMPLAGRWQWTAYTDIAQGVAETEEEAKAAVEKWRKELLA
jgi:hypothetical protein